MTLKFNLLPLKLFYTLNSRCEKQKYADYILYFNLRANKFDSKQAESTTLVDTFYNIESVFDKTILRMTKRDTDKDREREIVKKDLIITFSIR